MFSHEKFLFWIYVFHQFFFRLGPTIFKSAIIRKFTDFLEKKKVISSKLRGRGGSSVYCMTLPSPSVPKHQVLATIEERHELTLLVCEANLFSMVLCHHHYPVRATLSQLLSAQRLLPKYRLVPLVTTSRSSWST